MRPFQQSDRPTRDIASPPGSIPSKLPIKKSPRLMCVAPAIMLTVSNGAIGIGLGNPESSADDD
jgi:hypothetical protein